MTVAAAEGTPLSGKVTNFDGSGKPGVVVRLLGTPSLSTTTEANGSWSLQTSSIQGGSIPARPLVPGGHLVWKDGRLRVALRGADAAGRSFAAAPPAPSFPPPSARALAATVDTLEYSFDGTVFLRDTLQSLDRSEMVRTYDPTWNPAVVYGYLPDDRDGHLYKTVTVGEQVWMAENLNLVDGSSVGTCYQSSEDSCRKYGRSYTWSQAMAGASSSAENPSGVRGICPGGWHLPSQWEWEDLAATVGHDSRVAERHEGSALTAVDERPLRWGRDPSSDPFGFHGQFAGRGPYVSFVGTYGNWWTSTRSNTYSAYTTNISEGFDELYRSDALTDFGFSVRCVQDRIRTPKGMDSTLSSLSTNSGVLTPSFSSSVLEYVDTVESDVTSLGVDAIPSVPSAVASISINGFNQNSAGLDRMDPTIVSVQVTNMNRNTLTYVITVYHKPSKDSATAPWNTSIVYGSVADGSGKSYRTVKIGSQTWMAENLADSRSGKIGTCFNNHGINCYKYGRQYTWTEALDGSNSSLLSPSGVQGICPKGWHLPSLAEWQKLTDTVLTASTVRDRLIASADWEFVSGSDAYGFRVLPAGDDYSAPGRSASFWTASQQQDANYPSGATFYSNGPTEFGYFMTDSNRRFSVRCIQD